VFSCVFVCCVKYMSCLERIARAVGITLMNEELNVDETTRLIVDRATQLYDYSLHDKQSLIHSLQHKLKSLKERLDLKASDVRLVMGSIFTARRVCIARTMPWQDVCLSVRLSVCVPACDGQTVCLSVTRRYCV